MPNAIMEGSQQEWDKAKDLINEWIKMTTPDNEERIKVNTMRRDIWEGRHHKYTNVFGQASKEKPGHILAVFNYVRRMGLKVVHSVANGMGSGDPFKIKVVPEDESSEIETMRAESEERVHYRVLNDPENRFFKHLFKRAVTQQVREGDFALKVIAEVNERTGKRIKIYLAENMDKLHVVWDDISGTSYTAVIYQDLWTLDKIAREFDGFVATPYTANNNGSEKTGGNRDEWGMFAGNTPSTRTTTASGRNELPKALVSDVWGWFYVTEDEGENTGKQVWKMCNVILINDQVKQFIKSDYLYNPWILGHSLDNTGKPWSQSFIDDLIDPQIELNDRTGEEGDLIRVGANQKYVVINMQDFDAESVKSDSGQVIFIEGEGADLKPLEVNVNPFPSDTYINRVLEHLFNLGVPKIGLATGQPAYSGRTSAIQYQTLVDIVKTFRDKWDDVLAQMLLRIQQYLILFFPETHSFMSHWNEELGQEDGFAPRLIEFDWDNPMPMSRSDMIVDASTLYDRKAIPLYTYLEMCGFRDPGRIIKMLKKESKDPELAVLVDRFREMSPGVVSASLEARKQAMDVEEVNGQMMDQQMNQGQGTPSGSKPILQSFQNTERRGIPASTGTPGVGQVSQTGGMNMMMQNQKAGV